MAVVREQNCKGGAPSACADDRYFFFYHVENYKGIAKKSQKNFMWRKPRVKYVSRFERISELADEEPDERLFEKFRVRFKQFLYETDGRLVCRKTYDEKNYLDRRHS